MTMLTKAIAEDIVNRTMRILTHNINVMDQDGVIIGSGEKDRLGHFHAAALQVIRENKRIDIDHVKSKQLPGTKPGINLPIVFEKKIVGVVGITGRPEDISQFGELVKMGAELTLEQAALTHQLQWEERLREELVFEVINDRTNDLLIERAARMGIDLRTPRIAVLLHFMSDENERELAKIKQDSLTYLKNYCDTNDLVASVQTTKIVILKQFSESQSIESLYKRIEALLKQLTFRSNGQWQASIGNPFSELEDAKRSYQYAREALAVGTILYPENTIYVYDDLYLSILLHANRLPADFSKHYHSLVMEDQSGDLQTTLETYIDSQGELSRVAERLFIHRNTLSYRLEKIKRITGRDPRNIHDLLNLYIEQIAYKLQS
ncbi:sugar diacid recognition domain-containing protein [Oceanobacillus sp. HCA-5259]|uniref:sugar diacid recognition domain-containing protein n=1 Tax=Oceanobacillus sp. HCA-5259 TaxID=3134661 RepID=UPI0030BB0582